MRALCAFPLVAATRTFFALVLVALVASAREVHSAPAAFHGDGGATAPVEAPAEERSPTGPYIEFADPPAADSPTRSACSLRHPICVHAPPAVGASQTLATLAAADRAWDVIGGALDLPPPDPDLDGAWHVYITNEVASDGHALLQSRDPRARFDRGTTFAVVSGALAAGCTLDLALARALARAALAQAVPATDEGSARAQAEAVARLAAPCGAGEADALEFQLHPERAIVDAAEPGFDRGAYFFFEWLDATFARSPGALVRGLWALAPTRTTPRAANWNPRPTAFDVLRVSLKGALGPDSTLDDVFARFAVRRAQTTPSPRLAWHIAWPTIARRLASPEPVFPTGASYVLVDRQGAAPGAKLRVEADWEDYGRMRWFVIKLDAAGETLAILPVTSLERGTRAALTVESLDGVDRLLVVGANVGSTEHPFDPDQGEWEPHGWLLTVEAQ